MLKLVEITKAWIASYNPTPEQQSLARYRVSICNKCPNMEYVKELDYHKCGLCGCPISKKIFSPKPGNEACPDKRWEK
jgi:hypothetical protein